MDQHYIRTYQRKPIENSDTGLRKIASYSNDSFAAVLFVRFLLKGA
jgi:hypothetical protein